MRVGLDGGGGPVEDPGQPAEQRKRPAAPSRPTARRARLAGSRRWPGLETLHRAMDLDAAHADPIPRFAIRAAWPPGTRRLALRRRGGAARSRGPVLLPPRVGPASRPGG